MKIENVKLALTHYPEVVNKFVETCSVKSSQKLEAPAGIHKKGSTIALFDQAQKTKDYTLAFDLTRALKDETTKHPAGTLAHRKASDLLVNIYRWTKERPDFALRAEFFPEKETDSFEALLKIYKERKEVKRVLGQLSLSEHARKVIHYAFELEKD